MPGGALEQENIGSSSASTFVGQKLDQHRGAFFLSHPMDKGHVQDGSFDDMEKIFEHVYSKHHLNAKTDEHPVLLTEAPMNPRANREQIAELFFETYRAPAIFFSPPAVLSLYASGRATGVVLDVGEGVTHCVPVYEGYALKHSITRSDVAGRDVTKQLQLLLRKSGLAFTTTAESDLVKTMKEELCYVHQNVSGTDDRIKPGVGSSEDTAQAVYQLPDGQTVSISNERHLAPEVLFNPSLIGSEEVDVASALVNSIMKSDLDLRPTLFSQIVLAGGSTCTSGFGDRLLTEVRAKAPTHTRIRISAPPDRIHSAWAGGSILASLATFKNMWVTKAEYEEYGKEVLHRSGL
jgi:centractin